MRHPVHPRLAALILGVLLAPAALFAQQVTRLPLKTADLAYSAATGMIYASIPASATTNPNSIAVIDPARAVVTMYLPLGAGTDPNRLALSDTGRFLFVGLDGVGGIRRIDLFGTIPDFEFSLGSDSSGPCRAGDIAIQPGTTDVLVVSVRDRWGSARGLALYEGNIKRAVAGPDAPQSLNSITFGASASTLYAYNSESSAFDLCKFTVDASGLTLVKIVRGAIRGYSLNIHYSAGRVYGADGSAVDAETLSPVGSLPRTPDYGGDSAVVADPGSNRVFLLQPYSGSTARVSAYDGGTFRLTWSLDIENAGGNYGRRAFVSWGGSGLAFGSTGPLFLIDYSSMSVKRTLRVHKSGTGSGVVTAAAVGISCGTNCTGQGVAGTTAALSVVPDAGSSFSGWSGDADCADGSVTLSADTSCVATFTGIVPRPSVRRVALQANDLVWDGGRGLLHASVPGSEPGFGNAVVSINPATGQVVSSLYVGSEPNRLALTAGGLLYVALDGAAAVRRVNPGTGQADAAFWLGADEYFGPFRAENLAVQPGSDTVVAVARRNVGISPKHEGVAIYDNGVQRPNTTPDHTGSNEIAFGDNPADLFGYNNETTEFGYRRMLVDGNGVSVTNTIPKMFYGFGVQIRHAAGRIYSSEGGVVETASDGVAGRFAGTGFALVAPDPAHGQVIFLDAGNTNQTLNAYDAATFLPTWSVGLSLADSLGAGSFIRWGESGVAFRTASAVYIVDYAVAVGTPRVLRVNRTGTGDGRITSAPGGIDCRTSCSATFTSDAEVVLVAVAETGSTFAGWTGDADCSDGSVTMTASLSCTATFTAAAADLRPSITRLALPIQDVVFDPESGRLLATTDGTDPVLGNRIVSIDPSTGEVSDSALVGSQPYRLALSGTGRYAYIGLDGSSSVRRMELATGALGAPFSLGNDSYDGPRTAVDIAAQPGNDTVVAVAMHVQSVSPGVSGVAIFRDGVALPTQIPKWDSPTFVEFGDSPSALYASAIWGDNSVARLSLADDGVRLAATTRSAVDAGGVDIAFADGRLWASNGQVVDAETLIRTGAFKFDAFPSSSGASMRVAVNPANRLALVLIQTWDGPWPTLAAYDRDSYDLVWAVKVPLELYPTQVRRLVPWGTNGVAMVTSQPAGLLIMELSALADQRALSLTRAGSGSGVVAFSPGGTCGGACLQNFPAGSSVTITATPSVGSIFAGWRGDADCADGQLSMSSSHVCTASFTYVGTQYVSGGTTGTGTGTVASDPAGLNCYSSGCWGFFTKGTTVTLTATADTASVFAGWTGACSGKSACTVTLTSDQSVTAVFTTTVRDFSGDGQHDMVWHDRETGDIVFWNMVGAAGPTEVHAAGPADARWRLVGIGDFSGDRLPDLLWRNRVTGENVVWFMRDGQMFNYARINTVSDLNWQVAGVADFDLDGQPDILWHNLATGETVIWRMYGATYYSYLRLQTIPDPAWTIAAVDDFDGDANQEILWRNQSTGRNIVWQMDRTALASYAVFEALDDTRWQVATTGDFNGDGSADIVWRNAATGENLLWWMSGGARTDSAWLAPMTNPSWYPDHTAGVARHVPSDFNQDGKADLVWRNGTTGENRIWYMDGNAKWASRTLSSEPDTNWRIAGWGDLTGDGRPVIVWRNAATGENRLAPAPGTWIGIETVADPAWQIVTVADFNGDGKADLVWRNATTGMNLVWLMYGVTRTDYKMFPSVADAAWTIVGAADFNADGKTDLVWRNTTSGENIVWFMNGTSLVNYVRLNTLADLNWRVAAIADFDGDGHPDVFWRNSASGETRLWVMDGVSVAGESTGPAEPDLNWKPGSSR